MSSTETELAEIAERIRTRDAAQRADRRRQRELVRRLIQREGSTWTHAQEVARVSRATIMAMLRPGK